MFRTVGPVALALLFFGCKSGGGVSLLATVTTSTNVTVTPKLIEALGKASVKAALVPGDDGSDGWTDTSLTPTTFGIGINTATLVQPTTTVSPANYVIFDRSLTANNTTNNPIIIYLDSSGVQTIFHNPAVLPQGTYDTVQFEVVFYEMIIPVYDGAGNSHPRRVRYYLEQASDPQLAQVGPGHQSALPFDILISFSDNGFDFRWINNLNGSLNDTRSAIGAASTGGTTPPVTSGGVYQIPTSEQGTSGCGSSPSLICATLTTPINMSSGDQKIQEVTLNFDVTNTFFFDDTDTNPSNPNSSDPNFKGAFNYLDPSRPNSPTTPAAVGQSEDGWLNAACSNPALCTNAALFYPGPPVVSASFAEK